MSAVPPRILPLSARGGTALAATAGALAAFLDGTPDVPLDDVVTTLVHGREQLERRLAVVADDPAAAAGALRAAAAGTAVGAPPRTVFAFTGQGSQYTGMAAGAYAAFPEFRDWIDRADALLRDQLPAGLRECLTEPRLAATLARTDVAAAAVTAVQLGLVRVLERYGIRPDTVLGHSVGEFAAAAAAGAVEPEEALLLVARRGALMVERTEPGAMLAVRCGPAGSARDAAAVAELADATPGVCVAVHNSPRDLVLSGAPDAVAGLGSRLAADGLRTRRLHVSHAFHSERLVPMAAAFGAAAASVAWSPPAAARWVSCARGPMTGPPDAGYWVDHLLEPVRFWDALTVACAGDRPAVLVEIGPHPVLLALAGQLPEPPALVPVLARDRDARVTVAAAAAQAWCHGVPADLSRGVPGRRRHLPGYGFDRRVHSARPAPAAPAAAGASPAGAVPAGVSPAGALPAGVSPAGALPAGVSPAGTVPACAVPVGPVGPVDAAGPVGAVGGAAGAGRTAREVLAEVWTDLLGGRPEDDTLFVEAGGDSLSLLRLQQRVQAALGVTPALADLLDAGTFGAMLTLLPATTPPPATAPAAGPPAVAPATAPAAAPPAAPATVPAGAVPAGAAPAAALSTYRPSPVQQGMLLADLMHPGSNQHNVSVAVDIAGRVDGAAMAAAFRDAQVRHAALRTVFSRHGRDFTAEIRPEPGAALAVLDAPLDDDAAVRERARELAEPPVRCLDAAAPVRGTLVLGATRSLLVITAHHAVCDATSFGVLLEELAADHERHRTGRAGAAVPAPVQFHELHADRERAAGAGEPPSRGYWLDRLAGAPDLVPLPTDRPRPAVRQGAGAQWSWHLGPEPAARVRALAAELKTTVFSTMLAAYAVLLRLRSGADDLSIGTPATGRTTAAAERVFGPLLTMVVLRVRIAPGQTFAALVRDVQATVLDALGHSDFPFDRLVAELRPRRDPGSTPLFSVMFTMPAQFELPGFGGHPSRPVELPGLGAKFDLTLYVTAAAGGGLRLDLEYDPALFDEPTVRDVAAAYDALVTELVSDPGAVLPGPGAGTAEGPADADEPSEAGLTEMERYVAELWSETLGVQVAGATDDFFDAGGHSMLVLACLAEIQDRFPDATIQDFFTHRTVGTFATRLHELAGDAPTVPAGVPAAEPAPAAPVRVVEPAVPAGTADTGTADRGTADKETGDVLLTGAPGFLGTHLLATLLRRPTGAVVVVVRPRAGVVGTDRLREAVTRYAPDVLPELAGRVTVVEADLAELDPATLGRSIAAVGTVVHCAADTRMFGRIEDFRAANVEPTRRLAELARARGWRMAYVSTATAVGAAPGDGPSVVLREDDFDRGEEFDNPYSRSKFEAEQVVRRAIEAGLDATVHRIGGLVGDSRTGVFLPDPQGNMLYRLLRVIMRCGLVPDDPALTLNLTPVDVAAAAVLQLAGTPALSGRTFHVLNPVELTMPALAGILRDLGYAAVLAEPESIARWLSRAGADEIDREAVPFLGGSGGAPATVVRYDTRATTEALAGPGCPPPDLALLRVLVGHGVDAGFFPAPRLWGFVTGRPAVPSAVPPPAPARAVPAADRAVPAPARTNVLETERLVLRELTPDQVSGLLDALDGGTATDGYGDGYPLAGTGAAARSFRGRTLDELPFGFGMYLIEPKPGDVAVGDVGFHRPPRDGAVEIGVSLAEPARGRGYATEAVRALTRWAFSRPGVTRVVARTTPDNTGAQGILRRAGFRLERTVGDVQHHVLPAAPAFPPSEPMRDDEAERAAVKKLGDVRKAGGDDLEYVPGSGPLRRVVRDGARLLAYAQSGDKLGVLDPTTHLMYIVVHPAAARRGLATALLDEVLHHARAHGKKGLVTGTPDEDAPSIAWVRKHGFQPIGHQRITRRERGAATADVPAGLAVERVDRADAAAADEVVDLATRTVADATMPGGARMTAEPGELRRTLVEGGGELLVCRIAGRPVGWLALEPLHDGAEGSVLATQVLADAGGRGVPGALLEAAARLADRAGATSLTAVAEEDGQRELADALPQHGFHPVKGRTIWRAPVEPVAVRSIVDSGIATLAEAS